MFNSTIFIITLIFLIFFLLGASFLTAFNAAILSLGKFQTKELLKSSLFLFKKFFLKGKWEKFYILLSVTKHLLYLLYAMGVFLFLMLLFPKIEIHHDGYIFLFALITIVIFMFFDFIMRYIARAWSKKCLIATSFISSFYIVIFLVFTVWILLLTKLIFKKIEKQKIDKAFLAKDKVLEMIKDSELSSHLTSFDQTLIASFITFKEKVAREIMIPRVDIFAINSKTSILEVNKLLLSENYSRVPIYQDSLDNIIGVLMYKDLLTIYSKSQDNKELLEKNIDSIVKPVIYSPENKKISKLFQEFKNEKIHLAIVVNEYGGTEGIVTIEDILEELVGEIKDEYDIAEEKQFFKLPSGSIIIDAKMTIIDLEEQLGIKIPPNVEYETIGGYIFHRAGTIPSKGWKIHLDEFEIEILISNERCIEKIKITPSKKN